MKKISYIIGGLLVVFLGIVTTFRVNVSPIPTVGSVAVSNEYQSTTTDSTWNTPATVTGGFKLLCSGPGTLGSVIVTNETAGRLNIYNGTTTLSHPTHPTTTLANVYPSQAENAYPYDSVASIGLIAEFQSPNVASATITYRCY